MLWFALLKPLMCLYESYNQYFNNEEFYLPILRVMTP